MTVMLMTSSSSSPSSSSSASSSSASSSYSLSWLFLSNKLDWLSHFLWICLVLHLITHVDPARVGEHHHHHYHHHRHHQHHHYFLCSRMICSPPSPACWPSQSRCTGWSRKRRLSRTRRRSRRRRARCRGLLACNGQISEKEQRWHYSNTCIWWKAPCH